MEGLDVRSCRTLPPSWVGRVTGRAHGGAPGSAGRRAPRTAPSFLAFALTFPPLFRLLFQVEKELSEICASILALLDDHLIPTASSGESKVFYLKMKVRGRERSGAREKEEATGRARARWIGFPLSLARPRPLAANRGLGTPLSGALALWLPARGVGAGVRATRRAQA